jgi:hypothetical protein
LDISINNEIFKKQNIDNAADFETYIENYLSENNASGFWGTMKLEICTNEVDFQRYNNRRAKHTLIRLMDKKGALQL